MNVLAKKIFGSKEEMINLLILCAVIFAVLPLVFDLFR